MAAMSARGKLTPGPPCAGLRPAIRVRVTAEKVHHPDQAPGLVCSRRSRRALPIIVRPGGVRRCPITSGRARGFTDYARTRTGLGWRRRLGRGGDAPRGGDLAELEIDVTVEALPRFTLIWPMGLDASRLRSTA
jgi:hypothetical protein